MRILGICILICLRLGEDMGDRKLIEFSAKALIICDNKFLALHTRGGKSHKYELPGGRMEFGETAEETVVREILEETGLTITPISLVDTWNFVSETRQITGIIYLCALASDDKISLSEEHDIYEWLPIADESFEKMIRLFTPQMRQWDWEFLLNKVSVC